MHKIMINKFYMTSNLKCVGGVWATCALMESVLEKESALLWGAGKKYIF